MPEFTPIRISIDHVGLTNPHGAMHGSERITTVLKSWNTIIDPAHVGKQVDKPDRRVKISEKQAGKMRQEAARTHHEDQGVEARSDIQLGPQPLRISAARTIPRPTKKTWFIPPDFIFFPDGAMFLGSVIPGPWNPTATLASLANQPTIALPSIESRIEMNHTSSANEGRSTGRGVPSRSSSHGTSFFANIANLAIGQANVNVPGYAKVLFSFLDHEVRNYHGSFSPEALRAIMALDGVKEYINRSWGRKRPVFVITGLRVALKSFTVTEVERKNAIASPKGSGATPIAPVSLEAGAIIGRKEDKSRNSYTIEKGIVLAYQLHVIRPKGTGVQAELFSHPTAFPTDGRGDKGGQEMEIVEVK